MCSHYVLFKFSMGSQYVPQVPNVFSNMFSIAPTFIGYALANVVILSLIYVSHRGGTLHFKIEPCILGSLHSFIFLSDRPIRLAHCKKEKIELGRHLI